MANKGHKAKSRTIILKFLVLINIASRALAEVPCPKGQFRTSFTGDCSDCPEDPKTNCMGEGADAESCKQACIEDINECSSNPCHVNANCTDNEGSFDCECNVGFSGNGFNCSNINECLSKPCHDNANCTDSEGSFDCECNDGYSGNGFNCSNIDECLSNPCHVNASCTDNEGSYDCQCNVGFSGNGVICTNIDECLSKPCHTNASCTDNEGSFVCECINGFSGDGISNCANIDECLSISCHANAECLDSPGSYICRCKTGFNGNGTFCENDPSEQTSSGMNLRIAIGIPISLILLLLIAGLPLYCHRINKRCRVPRRPTEHEDVMEMGAMRDVNENNQPPQPPAPADDREYNGPETAPDLNKDNQGSLSSLLIHS